MNNLKELIKSYQDSGDRAVIEQVLKYVDEDLLKYGEVDENGEYVEHEDVDPLIFVAYRIRAFLLNNSFKQRQLKMLYEQTDEEKEEYEGLMLWLNDLIEYDWLNVNENDIFDYNFESIYKNKDEIKNLYGDLAQDLFQLIEKFDLSNQESEAFKHDFEAIKNELLPYFKMGLEYTLTRVDADRENKEIVKFINTGMMIKFIQFQMEDNGTKRIRKGNKSYYIKPKFNDNVNDKAWLMIIGKSLDFVGADAFDNYLTRSQSELLRDIFEIVRAEYKNENVESFWWSELGEPYLNKRLLAERLEIKEDNLNKRLKRIENKVNDNWVDVWNEHKKAV